MRIAAGDGNMADPSSAYCAHYPGSGAAKILGEAAKAWVDTVGMALLGRNDPGMYPPHAMVAMRWWNTLNGEQMVAALHGDDATPEQTTAARMMYADLDDATRMLVDAATAEIYGYGGFTSVGEWWETLDCRKMRIAAGDGNMADPSSAYCAHYPGSGAAKILGDMAKEWVDTVGMALLGRNDPGMYPPVRAMVPWFPAASDTWQRWNGVVRLINHSTKDAEVYIEAFDDEGMSHGPARLTLGAAAAVQLNAADLASGKAGRGLSEGIGKVAPGDLRLSVRSQADIEALAYVRSTDGTASSMHDLVPSSHERGEWTHRVAFFNPHGDRTSRRSVLRVINLSDASATIRIEGRDDRGDCADAPVELDLAAGAAGWLSASELESGEGEGLSGALGDGEGKWRLMVHSDATLAVMSLLVNRDSGAISNFSTAKATPMAAGCE